MSSSYHLLCLSHDPAILIERELTSGEVFAGRFSSPLIEAGCFGGMQMEGATGCKGCHSGIIWTDADWLRLLDAAATAGVGDDVLSPLTRCWPLDRLRRLRREIRLPETPTL